MTAQQTTSAGGAVWRFVKEIVIILVVALGLSFLVRTFIVQAFYVPSQSMENTLMPNDRILASKLNTRFGGVKRGEIVVFRDPGDWLDEVQKQSPGGIAGALEWVGLTDKERSKPAQLSGGESQRVAIARAMVKRPKIVLADEPTANLDADNSHNVLKMMVRLNQDLQTTFLFATHDEKVIGYLRRIISLRDGQVADDKHITPSQK